MWEREHDRAGDYDPFDPRDPRRVGASGRDYGYEGGSGGSYSGSRYPRMGREDWTTDDLGYQSDYARRDFGGRSDSARYADSGFYPSDNPSYRGGYARGRSRDDQRDFLDRAGDEVRSWFGDEQAENRREADNHRGKGPKGYTRSDDRIAEDVNDRLSDDHALDASDVQVSVQGAEVTLDGQVSSRRDKRRAEDCAESVSGVRHVQNNLRVKDSGYRADV
ncbi:BON domain-containing protein [Ciceribacter sp. L1K23]|nr:BON domain-containing protein [Ciceribacter sp. L1K23]